MGSAGDLVPVPEGSPDGDINAAITGTGMPQGPAGDSSTNDIVTAMMDRHASINMLKPNPQTARLAYLLLAADLDTPTVTSG
jgi:hypothetical protein